MSLGYSDTGATFCPRGCHRYTLRRSWEPLVGGLHAVFVGLNPSTADHREDDPTIRRCVGFARSWGFHRMTMVNLFSYRSTDPDALLAASRAIGEGNDGVIADAAAGADLVVAMWGAHRAAIERAAHIVGSGMLGPFAVLGLTKDGQPKHPLYLRRDVVPVDSISLRPVALPQNLWGRSAA